MGLRLKQFNMKVRKDKSQPFVDVGLLGSNVDADVSNLKENMENVLVDSTHPFKHLLCIGDSYSQGLPGANGQGWIYWLQYYWGLTQGTDIFYSPVRAGGFTDDGTVIQSGSYHRGFVGQINDLVSSMTSDERNNISDILICGGWNDNGADLSTVLLPHASTFNTVAKTNFPNARITLAYIAGTNVPSYFGDVQNGIFKYKTIAAQLKWRYIVNSEYVSRFAPLYGADDLSFHPNDYSQITRYIMEGFLSGSCNVRYGSKVTITPKTGYTLQYTNFATQIKANELAWEFPADYIRIVLSTPYSGYITDGITFGDLVGNIITPPYTRRINGSCGLKDNGKWYSAPGQLIINSNGEIGVKAAIANGGGNWQSMTSLSEIRFYSGTSNVIEGLNA